MTHPHPFGPTILLLASTACHLPDGSPDSMTGAAVEDSTRIERATADYDRAVDPERVVGLRHPPFDPLVEQLAMSLVDIEGGEPAAAATWVVTSARVEGRPVLLLSKVVERTETPMFDGDGRRVGSRIDPTLEIVDALTLPPLREAERLVLYGCTDRGERHVFPYIAWDTERPVVRDPRLAWGLDADGERLAVVDPAGVTCRNPRFPQG